MIKILILDNTEKVEKNTAKWEHKAGRMLLSYGLLKEYCITDAEVAADEQGKPFLPEYPQIYFNISHSRGVVVCALGDSPLGVDIEKIRQYRENILRKVLTAEEQQEISLHYGEEARCCFFRYWTLKESYVKAVGCGLRMPLEEITSQPGNSEVLGPVRGYCFRQTIWREAWYLTLCCQGSRIPELLIEDCTFLLQREGW